MTPGEILRLVRGVGASWHPTSIFPFEMAFFLAGCEAAGIGCIVETGRMHGYSTAVLAAYGGRRGVRVVSIDYEVEPSIARACRDRLTAFPPIELVRGEAFRELPRLLKTERRDVALLVDGPKNDVAVYLSAVACAVGTVRLVAHHNVMATDPWCEHFRARFPMTRRPDRSTLLRWEGFPEFREWERTQTTAATRDLEDSSLVLATLPRAGPDRRYLRGATARQTATAHLVQWWWRCGAPALRQPRLPLTGLAGAPCCR